MPKKAMETLTESMFYVLMAFSRRPMCGIEITDYIERKTAGRVLMGPATLYTIRSLLFSLSTSQILMGLGNSLLLSVGYTPINCPAAALCAKSVVNHMSKIPGALSCWNSANRSI